MAVMVKSVNKLILKHMFYQYYLLIVTAFKFLKIS
jgi:hypothetical protein